jgi:hypothetical protein
MAVLCWLSAPIPNTKAADYTLAMSEGKDVCQVMLKFANQGLLETEHLEHPSTFQAPEFAFVPWVPIPLADSFRDHNGAVEGALFDINSDGQVDWIVRIQWALGGLYSHELLIYSRRQESLFQESGFALQDENQADARLTLRGQPYFLTKIPKHKSKKGESYHFSIANPPFLIPFVYNRTAYILVANPFEAQELLLEGRRFAVVVKSLPSFQLQDVCYLEEIR